MNKKEYFEKKIDSLSEREILELLKQYGLTYPLDLEIIEEILQNTEPIELTDEKEELFLSTMRNTMELWKEAKDKLEDPNKASSFGELLFLYREKERLTVDELAKNCDIASSIMRSIEDDNDRGMKSNIGLYVTLSKLMHISCDAAMRLVLNSFRIFNMKAKKEFTRSYARADKNISESVRIRRNKEADNKILLRLSEKQETEQDKKEIIEIKEMLSHEFR